MRILEKVWGLVVSLLLACCQKGKLFKEFKKLCFGKFFSLRNSRVKNKYIQRKQLLNTQTGN